MNFLRRDYTIHGECPQDCGRCCTSILPLSQKEIDRILDYIHKNEVEFTNHNNVFSTQYYDICPFLNKDKRCNIYSVRPEVCRTFVCNLNNKHYNHNGKHIINMLTTFGPPDIFLPKGTPDAKLMDKEYQQRKKETGIN